MMVELERRFNLPGAVYVCQEMARIAHRQNALDEEAIAYRNFSRYYDAMGDDRQAALSIEKAVGLFEQAGNRHAVTEIKMIKLEHSLKYRKVEEVLPEMNALLARAEENGDTLSMGYLHTRMIEHALEAERYDEAAAHVAYLEKMTVSSPLRPNDYGIVIHAARGRAELARARNDLNEAERYYQKALRYCEEEPSRWLEIHILQSLAELEWSRGNAGLAESYLNKAQTKAENLELDDLLTINYGLKAQIAEEEGRYADALAYTKKKYAHEKKFERKSAGFDVENYYLQKEKNELAVEKKNQELELRLKKEQLRNSAIITALVFLMAFGLVVGYYKQRKRRRELAAQNALIRQQAEQLKNLDEAKSRFFANVSHELRTPLTLMLGPVQTLLIENRLSEKQIQLLQTARQSGKQLEELVNEILDLRKLEMGKMELRIQPTALTSFFRNNFAQFDSLAQRKEIDFSFEINVNESLTAGIDQAKCRQIANNLLSNAFKFTPLGGRIKADLSLDDGILQLEVADSGPGIHPDDLPYVFDRFFQTNLPDKPAEGGTGIGLALCREYARLFRGKIEVESRLGEGATFRVAFPVEIMNNAPATDGSPKPEAAGKPLVPSLNGAENDLHQKNPDEQKPTILVVEDNPELQDYLRLLLSEKYYVLTAGNGRAALDCLQQPRSNSSAPTAVAHCRLILSDLMMPVMDGYQLLEKLKSDDATRHIPVVMLTARADARDKLKALRIGVDDYLLKPFDEEELLARIENLLENQATRQEEAQAGTKQDAAARVAPVMSETDREWLETFETFVWENISSDILSVPMLAHEFAMSESTLLRQLKRLTGLSPLQYLQEMRLDKARRLLENRTYNSMAKVASQSGYSDVRSFSRRFKQRFGKLPSEVWRES